MKTLFVHVKHSGSKTKTNISDFLFAFRQGLLQKKQENIDAKLQYAGKLICHAFLVPIDRSIVKKCYNLWKVVII